MLGRHSRTFSNRDKLWLIGSHGQTDLAKQTADLLQVVAQSGRRECNGGPTSGSSETPCGGKQADGLKEFGARAARKRLTRRA
jgi:hypothetical protein